MKAIYMDKLDGNSESVDWNVSALTEQKLNQFLKRDIKAIQQSHRGMFLIGETTVIVKDGDEQVASGTIRSDVFAGRQDWEITLRQRSAI